MTMYDDFAPEDGYDAGDPIGERIATLIEIVEAVRDDPDDERRARRRDDALRVIDAFRNEIFVTGQHLRQLQDQLEEIT